MAETELNGGGHPWYAIQVRVRQERIVAHVLRCKGYEEFLPLYSTTKRWSDRTKLVEQALFPGYLFCRLDINQQRCAFGGALSR